MALELHLRREDQLLPIRLSATAAAWVVRIVKIAEQTRSIPLDPRTTRRLLLCRSAQRREKEYAIISRAEERFLADGDSLRKRIETGHLKTSDVIERKIGALLKKHLREPDDEQQRIYTQLGIDWKRAFPSHKAEVNP